MLKWWGHDLFQVYFLAFRASIVGRIDSSLKSFKSFFLTGALFLKTFKSFQDFYFILVDNLVE